MGILIRVFVLVRRERVCGGGREPEILGEGKQVAMAVPTEDVGMCLSAEREREETYPDSVTLLDAVEVTVTVSGVRTGTCHEQLSTTHLSTRRREALVVWVRTAS